MTMLPKESSQSQPAKGSILVSIGPIGHHPPVAVGYRPVQSVLPNDVLGEGVSVRPWAELRICRIGSGWLVTVRVGVVVGVVVSASSTAEDDLLESQERSFKREADQEGKEHGQHVVAHDVVNLKIKKG